MKEIIQEIKKCNGNENIKNKDLLWYLIAKTDKIEAKMGKLVPYHVFFPILAVCLSAIGFLFTLIPK